MVSTAALELERVDNRQEEVQPGLFRRELPYRALSAVCGAVLGLSAPGFGQWYLPWIGMIPLFYFTVTAKTPWIAGVRGFYFGAAYNLVYTCWYLYFRATYAAGTFGSFPIFESISFWVLMSMYQGLFISIYPCVLKAIPLTGGWLPSRHKNGWLMPSFIVAPLLWVIIEKMCNTPGLLGVPWSFGSPWAFLEYSQYKQLPIIQVASLIGGVGISACMVLSNLAIFGAISFGRRELQSVSYSSRSSMIVNSLTAIALLLLIPIFGFSRLSTEAKAPKEKMTLAAIQSGLSEEVDNISEAQILRKHLQMCKQCPGNSICIWPEWALPMDFSRYQGELKKGALMAESLQQSWVIGVFDSGNVPHRVFNSVCAFEDGKVLPDVYHKLYPVPFGEFTPVWVKESILRFVLYGCGRRFADTTSGDRAVVLNLRRGAVAPVLCFETIMPGLVAEGVRGGAKLIVDCSYTGWFHESILSDQMIAFCVMRAVENHRPFVFSTTYGPSVIVDPVGRVLKEAPRKQAGMIVSDVSVEHDITPFTRFCLF